MATFGTVLEDLDNLVSDTAPVQNSWETDKRAAIAAMLPRLMGLATDLQRQEALLRQLASEETDSWWQRKWRLHHEATLEVMTMLGLKPAEHPHDLLM